MKIGDIVSGGQIRTRAIEMQQKTGRPVRFEMLPDARASLLAWLERRGGTVDDYVFPTIRATSTVREIAEWIGAAFQIAIVDLADEDGTCNGFAPVT